MKSKKTKTQRSAPSRTLLISDDGCKAISHALLFLMNLKDFSFESEKIGFDSADRAEDKLYSGDTMLTRSELRAAIKAIDMVCLRLPGHLDDYSYIDEEIPGLVADLASELPLLQQLRPVLRGHI